MLENLFLPRIKPGESVIRSIPAEDIMPCRWQPRTDFDPAELSALAKSISQLGLLQPLTVRKTELGIELVCGERRLRAARLAGLKNVPCLVSELSDSAAAIACLTENLQRKDLSFFEQAEGLRMLIEEFSLTQQQAAVQLGMSQPAVANKLRLLRLTPEQRAVILREGLTERQARALLRAKDELREEALQAAIGQKLTAEGIERYIDELNSREKRRRSYQRRSAALGDVRLFFNTVEKAVKVMQLAGVNAETERKQNDGFIEYVIKIPERSGKR